MTLQLKPPVLTSGALSLQKKIVLSSGITYAYDSLASNLDIAACHNSRMSCCGILSIRLKIQKRFFKLQTQIYSVTECFFKINNQKILNKKYSDCVIEKSLNIFICNFVVILRH